MQYPSAAARLLPSQPQASNACNRLPKSIQRITLQCITYISVADARPMLTAAVGRAPQLSELERRAPAAP